MSGNVFLDESARAADDDSCAAEEIAPALEREAIDIIEGWLENDGSDYSASALARKLFRLFSSG